MTERDLATEGRVDGLNRRILNMKSGSKEMNFLRNMLNEKTSQAKELEQ